MKSGSILSGTTGIKTNTCRAIRHDMVTAEMAVAMTAVMIVVTTAMIVAVLPVAALATIARTTDGGKGPVVEHAGRFHNFQQGNIMKRLLLISSLLALGLSGCYVVPHRGQDEGYRGDRDQRHESDRDRSRDRDGDRDRSREWGRDGYR